MIFTLDFAVFLLQKVHRDLKPDRRLDETINIGPKDSLRMCEVLKASIAVAYLELRNYKYVTVYILYCLDPS